MIDPARVQELTVQVVSILADAEATVQEWEMIKAHVDNMNKQLMEKLDKGELQITDDGKVYDPKDN